MKQLLFAVLLLTFIVSCVQPTLDKENVKLVDQYVQAVENLDYETMEGLLAEDYLGLGPSYGDSIRKPEAVANLKRNIESLYQSIDYDRSRNIAVSIPDGPDKGEWVSNWAELTIVYKKDQQQVKIWANTIYKIDQGKIVKSMTFYNEADVLEQLGFVFVNPNEL